MVHQWLTMWGAWLGARGWGWERPASGPTIFSASGGRCSAALPKIWCKQAWSWCILVQVLLEPHYLEWNFTFFPECWWVDVFARDDSVSQEETCDVPLSARFETLEITWSVKWVCPKMGYLNWPFLRPGKRNLKPGGFLVPISKSPKPNGFLSSAYLHRSFLLYYSNFQNHSDPADTRGGKVGFEPASGVPRVHLSESLKVRLTASLTKK